MPRQREILALLTTVAALGAAGSAAAKSRPAPTCDPPASGYVACLQVLYRHADDGSAAHIRVKALLMQRVDRCPARPARRMVTLTRSGDEPLATARRPGTCRNGLVRWKASFGPATTKSWHLEPGDSLDAAWTGTKARTSVRISPPPAD